MGLGIRKPRRAFLKGCRARSFRCCDGHRVKRFRISRAVLRSFWAGVALAAIAGCQQFGIIDQPPQQATGFDRVKPILENRCLPCHQGDFMGAPVPDFRTAKALYDPARQPRIIVPGDPERSRMMQVTYLTKDSVGAMPPLGHGLSLEEKNTLGEWIRQGAEWPDGETLQSAAVADMKKAR